MPLVSDAVFLPSRMHIFTAPTTLAMPTIAMVKAAPDVVPQGMDDLGHTDLEDDVEFDVDGGDSETKGSRQAKALREIVEETIDRVTVRSIQLTNDILTLFHGGGTTSNPNRFDAPSASGTTAKAVLFVFIDGAKRAGLWWPLTSIRRDGGLRADAENFLAWPLRITRLTPTGKPPESWLADGLGTTPATP
ncbi:hypothetical protein NLX83_21545 [Allokutzneria sp. A3M-2-11 16]|uniref:phage tail tube protein n=1 Tax=Allokutzneria sp. A3M-2-11 16 TaxID=2962043 RepID=UPI0020B85FBE|nr:hypothetical protein [Allokutzneria sp. A3M-2-11 16]MCP3801854.1 hypothetical protein [Allokutzneria sp. A3M-2-11 16]